MEAIKFKRMSILFTALFLVFSFNADAQTFLKKYPYFMSGTSLDNKSNTTMLLSNNNSLVISAIKLNMDSSGLFGTNSTFFKTDLSGNLIFSKTFRNPDETRPSDIVETSDGGFIISGHTNSIDSINGVFSFVLMTDSLGNVMWSKIATGSIGTYGLKVVMINDSICIGTSSYNSPQTGSDIYYYGFNKNGNVLFEKLLRSNGNEGGRSILADNGNAFLLGNTINSFDTVNEFLLVKIGEDGSTQWKKRYHFNGTISNLEGLFIAKKNDSTYAVAGSIYNNSLDFFLCEIDTNGNVLNSRIYDVELYDDITSLSSDNYNGYLINCLTKPVNGPSMFTAISIDSNLNITNAQKVLDSHYGFGTQGPSIIKHNTSVYLGGIQFNNNPITATPFIMKLDSNLTSNCASSQAIVNTYNLPVISTTINLFTFEDSVSFLESKNIFSIDISFSDSTYCSTITGVNNNYEGENTLVFPNPNTGVLTIAFSEFGNKRTVEIVDLAGKVLQSEYLLSSLNTLNLTVLENGIYFVKIMDEFGANEVHKIVINK